MGKLLDVHNFILYIFIFITFVWIIFVKNQIPWLTLYHKIKKTPF